MKKIDKILLLTTMVFFMHTTFSLAQTQSGFRGSERSGIYIESGLLKSWPAEGPALLWEASGIGTGYSSAVASEDAIYITGRKGGNDVLTSFSFTGKKNWEVIYGKSDDGNYPDSRCTPSVSGKSIFLVSGQGDMVCVNSSGKVLWSVNYFEKYKGKIPQFGVSESPVVAGNLVIGTPGGNLSSMVAFNAANGSVAWAAPSIKDGTNYVNPILISYGSLKMIVTVSEGRLFAVNSENGKLLWNINYEGLNASPTGDRNHANTPVYRDGFILAANGYEQVAVKFKLNADGSEPSVVWKNTDLTPHVGGMVLLGNLIFSSTHDTNSKGRWICVDWNSGKTLWIKDWYNKGSVISADGLLYIFEEKSGHVGLLNPDPAKMDVISEFQVTKGTGPYWSHPMINNGRLYVRHGDYMAVYALKKN
jgi:outer membrane protein assembly factor BamB